MQDSILGAIDLVAVVVVGSKGSVSGLCGYFSGVVISVVWLFQWCGYFSGEHQLMLVVLLERRNKWGVARVAFREAMTARDC
jgi:hypothetical protein